VASLRGLVRGGMFGGDGVDEVRYFFVDDANYARLSTRVMHDAESLANSIYVETTWELALC